MFYQHPVCFLALSRKLGVAQYCWSGEETGVQGTYLSTTNLDHLSSFLCSSQDEALFYWQWTAAEIISLSLLCGRLLQVQNGYVEFAPQSSWLQK